MNSKIVNVIKKGELIFLMEKETKKSLLLITFGVVLFALLMHFSEVIKILQSGVFTDSAYYGRSDSCFRLKCTNEKCLRGFLQNKKMKYHN